MTTVNDYLEKVEPWQKTEFNRIRKAVKLAAPDAELVISYGMPTFRRNKRNVIYIGAFKQHMSIFPATGDLMKDLGEQLAPFHSSKGTLQFTPEKPIPDSLLKKIIAHRLEENR